MGTFDPRHHQAMIATDTSKRRRDDVGLKYIWQPNQTWDYAQTNDKFLRQKDPQIKRLAEADNLTKTNPEAGFHQFLRLAEEGSAWAMYRVGFCYSQGRGVIHNDSRAEHWYRRSLECGCSRAMLDLGHLLAKRGDLEGAEAVVESLAANGWAPALFWLAHYRLLGSRTRQTLREVRPLLERAAAQGSPGAQWTLARHMAAGRLGLREISHGWHLLLTLWAKINPELRRRRRAGRSR